MSRFSRTASKYRHTSGSIAKKDQWYPDLKATASSGDYNSIAASGKWVAFSTASTGNLGLLALTDVGKRKTNDLATIHAHGNEVTDLQFSPFSDDVLATASDDGVVKLWSIPEDNKDNISTATVTLSGHRRRVDTIRFNPTASNVIASGSSDKALKIWDVEAGKEQLSLDGVHEDIIHSVSWSWDGSLLATSSKDGKVRIIDPRANNVVQVGEGHKGVKASRIVWLGPTLNRLASTGFSKTRDRQFALWDTADLSKPISMNNLDSSTGVIDLIFDADTNLLFLCGKGDGAIRMYEIYDSAPNFQELATVSSDVAQKSTASVPKRSLDLMNTEVVRLLKLTPNAIAPVSYTVPRKSKTEFQEDLYPPTPSTEPSVTASEWFGGASQPPKLIQLRPTHNPNKFWEDETPANSTSSSSSSTSSYNSATPAASSSGSSSPRATATGNNSSSHNNTPAAVEEVTEDFKQVQVVRSSKFRHISGKGTKPEACYTNLQVNLSAPNNSFIRANPHFIAVPWRGTGGQVAVIPFSRTGRQPDKIGAAECGSECLDFDFNPFDDHVLATVTEAAHLQIWKIPQGGYKAVERTPDLVLKGHTRRVTSVDFHPLASNVVATTSGDFTVRLWDIQGGGEKLKLEEHGDAILSLTWNYDANQLATASKDKLLRIFDPRSNKVTAKGEAHDGAKGFKAAWLGSKDQIVTVGHSKSSQRQIALWDTRNLSKYLTLQEIDQGAGIITPIYDPDTGVVYLAGKGDGNIKMFEINAEAPYVHYLTEYRTMLPAFGLATLPKTFCDVKNCEIATFLKLNNDYVEQLHFTVPRTRMEFFQDDLFPPTRDTIHPTSTADEWFGGANKTPKTISLQPQGMTPLSQAPVEKKVKKYDFKAELSKEDNRFTKEKLLDKYYQQMGNFNEKEEQVLKQDLMEGVEDSEWD